MSGFVTLYDRDVNAYVVIDTDGNEVGLFPSLHEAECFVLSQPEDGSDG